MYDVAIVGASFAGLAVAAQLKDYRVLLLDRKPIGSGQTSACGTILRVLEYWGLTEAVLEVHDQIVLHTKQNTFRFRSPYPWCTFDYRLVAEQLFAKTDAEFMQASAIGYVQERIETTLGHFEARCVVDASGWRSSLARSMNPHRNGHAQMSFGIETIQPLHLSEFAGGLHFFYQPSILTHGVGWIFPHGSTASIGLGSYRGPKPLKKALSQFADRHDLKVGQIHGTRFPSRLSSPTEGPLFIVGDAAGMCLGMTGEGIRPALFFGEACGRIIRRTLEGQISLEQGLTEYRDFVYAYREFFTIFTLAQFILTRLPTAWIDGVARIFRNDRIRHWFLQQYWGLTRSWDEVGVQSRKQY